jgi:hypothetical protein
MRSMTTRASAKPICLAAVLLFSAAAANAAGSSNPQLQTPVFPSFLQDDNASDYRPVVNANGTAVIFERTFKDTPKITKLYIGNFVAQTVSKFIDVESERADWCWLRSGGSLIVQH